MFVERRTRMRSMTSTSPLTIAADLSVPSIPSLSLGRPRFAAAPLGAPAGDSAAPAGRAFAAPLRRGSRPADPADPTASTPSRARFRRLVVFTGQLS
jgi:hypothetical protein